MARLFWTAVLLIVLLFILREAGALGEGRIALIADYVLGLVCSFSCPLFLILMFYAPGLLRDLTGPVEHWWQRFQTHRRVVEDLEHKIARLNKAHHMAQLGSLYLQDNRPAKAIPWLEKALAQEPDAIDTQYRLGLCRFELGEYAAALPLLEAVHAAKPDHDYGVAYLRLAQTYQRLGQADQAREVFATLLRFYPGHPEGSYSSAMLSAEQGDLPAARDLLREMIFSVQHSPRFQRRRNRHWLLKAKYWQWRHGK